METVAILPYTSLWENVVIWIITLVNSVLMSLMVSVTSFKCSPMTIAQTIMLGLPEGMATSEWQVIPQCVPCPQSDPISSLPNFAISSKHGHFGLQKKTRLGWLWRHTWRLQICGPQTIGCLRSCRRQSQVKVLESSLDNQGDVANLLSKKLICSQNRPDLPGNTHTQVRRSKYWVFGGFVTD